METTSTANTPSTTDTTSTTDTGSSHDAAPWMTYLDEEMEREKGSNPASYHFSQIFRDVLFSTDESRVAETVSRINSFYMYGYLDSDPSVKYLKGSGTVTFLYNLYNLVLDVICVIPAGDPNQEVLVELLVGLRKQPPTSSVHWSDTAPAKDPVLEAVFETYRIIYRPRRGVDSDNEKCEKDSDEWINLCAFTARCFRSGLLDHNEGGCGYALYDISKGLQQKDPQDIIQERFETVAVNYILFAGPKIFQDIFARPWQHPELEEGIGKWLAWRKRIEEIAESKGAGSALGRAAREAHGKMNHADSH